MPQCNFIYKNGEKCEITAVLKDGDPCVLHRENKTLEDFRDVFWDKFIFQREKDARLKTISCEGFFFPPGFRFEQKPKKCIEFIDSTFGGDSIFSNLDFEFGPFFEGCVFLGDLNFHNVKTGGHFIFENIKRVEGDVMFTFCNFKGLAEFNTCLLSKGARFSRCEVAESESFEFKNIKSMKEIVFVDCSFPGSVRISNVDVPAGASVVFERINLERSQNFLLSNVDIARVQFVDTNLEKVDFENCNWPTKFDRFVFSDEASAGLNQMDNEKLDRTIRNYRMLKHNFDKKSKVELASDMYIGEMDARREKIARSKWGNPFIKNFYRDFFSLLALYRRISFYGERYRKAMSAYLLVLFIFPMFYLLNGFAGEANSSLSKQAYSSDSVNYDIKLDNLSTVADKAFWQDWLKALRISFAASTLQKNEHYKLRGLGPEIFVVQNAISASIIALFLLALRRKFKR